MIKLEIFFFFVTSVILASKGEEDLLDLLDLPQFFKEPCPWSLICLFCAVETRQWSICGGKDSVTENKDTGKYRGKNFFSSPSCVFLWVWFSGLNTCAFLFDLFCYLLCIPNLLFCQVWWLHLFGSRWVQSVSICGAWGWGTEAQ